MTDIFKAKDDKPISNGSSSVNNNGKQINYYDSSKDKDPDVIDIENLYNLKFDDPVYYWIGPNNGSVAPNIPNITPSPTRTVTPTISATPGTTASATPTVTPTTTPTVSVSFTPSATPTISVTPTITASVTPTVTPSNALLPQSFNPVVVASNSDSSAISTDDGTSWILNNLSSSQTWNDVIYSNSQYLACAYNYNILNKSTDGSNWSAISLTGLANVNNLWQKIFYGANGYILLAASSYAARSTDGDTWSTIQLPANANWQCGAYGNNTYLAVVFNSSISATSPDGVTWTQRALPVIRRWVGLQYFNNRFWMVGNTSTDLLWSNDAISWNTITLPNSNDWLSLAYGNNTITILSNYETILTSNDNGVSWTSRTILGGAWKDVTYNGNNFIIIGNGNVVLTSANGISWTQRSITSKTWQNIT